MKRSVVIAAVTLGAWCLPAVAAEQRAPKHVSAEQAIGCIKIALSAKPGNIREMEVKTESNKTVCEVEIIASDGKKFEVYVDVASGKVLRVDD
jgi:uncharacterized membrane protein YkoI